jgi:hypothetical protein
MLGDLVTFEPQSCYDITARFRLTKFHYKYLCCFSNMFHQNTFQIRPHPTYNGTVVKANATLACA